VIITRRYFNALAATSAFMSSIVAIGQTPSLGRPVPSISSCRLQPEDRLM
jgi:hypothetical protein